MERRRTRLKRLGLLCVAVLIYLAYSQLSLNNAQHFRKRSAEVKPDAKVTIPKAENHDNAPSVNNDKHPQLPNGNISQQNEAAKDETNKGNSPIIDKQEITNQQNEAAKDETNKGDSPIIDKQEITKRPINVASKDDKPKEYIPFVAEEEMKLEVKPAPFLPGRAHTVLLLSYQRTGSTFLGDYLFANRPDAYYLFEPLDGAYSAMYGIPVGWTIPADVTTYENGSLRVPPTEELQAVSNIMDSILSCKVSSIPEAMFLHKYSLKVRTLSEDFLLEMSPLEYFINCSKNVRSLIVCGNYISKHCGTRFRKPESLDDMEVCRNVLWNKQRHLLPEEWVTSFTNYDACIRVNMQPLYKCIRQLQKGCQGSPLHAMKTVRATMDQVEPLLQADPNFRLIHFYRDPRAVYRSRRSQSWTWGAFEQNNKPSPWKTAFVYCQTVTYDYKRRKELEKKYPGRILGVVYDHFMQDPVKYTKVVYDFLGVPATYDSGRLRVKGNETSPEQSKKGIRSGTTERWQSSLAPDLVEKIEMECQEFANTVGAKWRKT